MICMGTSVVSQGLNSERCSFTQRVYPPLGVSYTSIANAGDSRLHLCSNRGSADLQFSERMSKARLRPPASRNDERDAVSGSRSGPLDVPRFVPSDPLEQDH